MWLTRVDLTPVLHTASKGRGIPLIHGYTVSE